MDEKKRFHDSWSVPQLCFAIFAIVSAFTTAQGMTETFFDGDYLVGFAIAIGIQLLLVWLNKETPKLITNSSLKRCILIGILYVVTIVWSTGFSFVYICNHVYSSVYMRDDQAYLAEIYQESIEELRNISDKDMQKVLTEISEKIVAMKGETVENEWGNEADTVLSVNNLELYYANDYMMMKVLEKCTGLGQNMGNLQEEEEILVNEKEALDNVEKEINNKIMELENEINGIEDKIKDIAEDKYGFRGETTIDSVLQEQIDRLEKAIIEKDAEIEELKNTFTLIKKVREELVSVESYIKSKTSNIDSLLMNNLNNILKELGGTTPDIEKANSYADEMYVELCNLAMEKDEQDVYNDLLSNFFSLKSNLQSLENIIVVKNVCLSEDYSIFKETEQYVSIYPTEEELQVWMKGWNNAFAELKGLFYKLPSIESKEVDSNYEEIVEAQRNVLTELNGIERSMYYLGGQQNILAWFSLLLALFLDASPVVFMFIRSSQKLKAV